METIVLSSKFQIVIPKAVRQKLKLTPGQKLQIIEFENKIELLPLGEIKKLRGVLKGMDTTVKREKDRL